MPTNYMLDSSKKDEQIAASLIDDNKEGDDRNLSEHGEDGEYYYSIGDGSRLLIPIRQRFNYKQPNGLPFTIKAPGEEYSATRENADYIFIAEPYYIGNFYIGNFSDSFSDDVKNYYGYSHSRPA